MNIRKQIDDFSEYFYQSPTFKGTKIEENHNINYEHDYVIPVIVSAHMFIMIFIIRITMNTMNRIMQKVMR